MLRKAESSNFNDSSLGKKHVGSGDVRGEDVLFHKVLHSVTTSDGYGGKTFRREEAGHVEGFCSESSTTALAENSSKDGLMQRFPH